MTLGDQPAFPVPSTMHHTTGMTYRMWLVGQIAKGTMANPNSWDSTPENITRITFDQVDAIIKRLEEEGK